jgi:hypothetical protein
MILSPPPLIGKLEEAGCVLEPSGSSWGTTITSIQDHCAQAFHYLKRCRPGDLEKADLCLDAMFVRGSSSKKGHLLPYSIRGERLVMTFTGLIDEGLSERLHGWLIFKRYAPERIRDIEDISALFYDAEARSCQARRHLPRLEIVAGTMKYLIGLRAGKNAAFEYLNEHPAEGKMLLDAIEDDVPAFDSHAGAHLRFRTRGFVEEYAQKFCKGMALLESFMPEGALPEFRRRYLGEADYLAQRILSERLVLNLDPTAPNIMLEDGVWRYIDLEKISERHITDGHRRCQYIWDESFGLSQEERLARIGEERWPISYYANLWQSARAVNGDFAVPFRYWERIALRRAEGFLENLRTVAIALRGSYGSAALLAQELDFERAKASISIKVFEESHGTIPCVRGGVSW